MAIKKGQRSQDERFAKEFARLVALFGAGKIAAVETGTALLLKQYPGNPYCLKLMGAALLTRGAVRESLPLLRQARERLPRDPELAMNLGAAMWELGDREASLACFREAVGLSPKDVDLRQALAKAYRDCANLGAAAEQLHAGLSLQPDHLGCLRELALVSQAAGADEGACELFARVVEKDGQDPSLWGLFGHALRRVKRYRESAEAFAKSHALSGRRSQLLEARYSDLHWANWRGLDEDVAKLNAENAADPLVGAFTLLAVPGLEPEVVKAAVARYASGAIKGIRPLADDVRELPPAGRPLRIGYLSADFHGHATSELLVGVIERHDRARVEVYGYSYGPDDDDSAVGARIRGAFDVLREVRDLDLAQTAQRIRDDRIDILVDLKGWTHDTRSRILAWRPAPVQVNWLGYPGTLGARELADYVIGDRWVTPLTHREQFAETLALMPNSYQPNDDRRPIGPVPTRAQAGLPEEAFVFCSFNQTYKLNPDVADLWGRILRATPESVLWLLDPGADARQNLIAEFERRGVAASRLVFAERLPVAEHLGRLALADLALDTFPYSSHTTASDVLWAGVPILTLPGPSFASRVGASLLDAVGLPELIAESGDDYVARAVRLAGDRGEVQRLRAYLTQDGRRSPLFDTAAFARNLEDLYEEMWRRSRAGDWEPIVLGSTESAGAVPVPEGQDRVSASGVGYPELIRLYGEGRYEEVVRGAQRMLDAAPDDAKAQVFMGVAMLSQGRLVEAREVLEAAWARNPTEHSAVFNLGVLAWKEGLRTESCNYYASAVAAAPRNVGYRLAYARACFILRDYERAEREFRQVLADKPDSAEALVALASILIERWQLDAALDHVQRAEGIDGFGANGYRVMGTVLRLLGRPSEAATAYRQAYRLDGAAASLVDALHAELYAADWQALPQSIEHLRGADLAAGNAVAPFACLSIPGVSPAMQRTVADVYAEEKRLRADASPEDRLGEWTPPARLRVGYFSSDFHHHATSMLLVGVIERHDRAHVEVFGYSYGNEDDGELATRIRSAFDCFRDISALGPEEAAALIRADRIDILVDLKGWTFGSRTGLLSLRPAPVQVSWLGFPGTLGGDYVDYVIGDAWVTSLADAPHYAEKLALLPHSYQPNDDRRSLPRAITREQIGLPASAFVYCCFNQAYKINPAVCDLWSEILRATPDSVLWLLIPGDDARVNLVAEFAARGVADERLYFAHYVGHDDHLSRLALADVALDTFPYGSHTTGSDALWAGVPLVTLPGETFASRVGASLLAAVGLPELIADGPARFVEIAVDLYRDRERLGRMRQYLCSEGRCSPLFDTGRFTRNLERLYSEMCRSVIAGSGEPVVIADDSEDRMAQGQELDVEAELARIRGLLGEGLREDAVGGASGLMARAPDRIEGYKLAADALLSLGRIDECLSTLRRAVSRWPTDAELSGRLGVVAWQAGFLDESRACLERAVSLNSADAGARVNLARLLRQAGDLGGAAAQLQAVLAGDLGHVDALRELGQVTLAAGADDAARELFERVLSLKPGDPEACFGLGTALRCLRRFGESADAFRRAYAHGGAAEALLSAIHADGYRGGWNSLAEDTAQLLRLIDADPAPVMHVFPLLAVPGIDSKHILRATEAMAAVACAGIEALAQTERALPPDDRPLRIGYLSCDFHSHATSSLLVGVIEAHDRSRFEVYAYSYGPDDGSGMSARVRRAFDVFREVGERDVRQTAELIRDDRVDILVDLKGWTQDGRVPVLAYRPAPIQVNWLGFPGSLGRAGLADFIVGDRWVTPAGHADCFSETIAQLPACYQANDDRRPVVSPPARESAGLPEGAFVYCSFNQTYKINPAVADLWARVLAAAPQSVLWLLDHGTEARSNITQEFVLRGIAAERLIFAPPVSWDAHLSRLALADAALDTFPCGSHTTGSDALWAGVPLVSLPGETFASRVGASLLDAVGLPELIAADEEAFVRIAAGLCLDRAELQRVKTHLNGRGRKSPLFDTATFTRQLEALYVEMCRRQRAGDRSPILAGDPAPLPVADAMATSRAQRPARPSSLFELLRPQRLTEVVDIGANPIDGDPPYLPMLREGLCRVTGFEPQEQALAALQRKKGPNERYLPYAVGSGEQGVLRVCRASGMTSLFEPDQATLDLFEVLKPCGEVVERVPLSTRKLDEIAEITMLDFLKIDIQGGELAVFSGGRKALETAVAVQTEVSFVTLYEGQPALGDIDLELRRQGFIPHCFAAVKQWPIAPANPRRPVNQLLEADIVYVRDFSRPERFDDEQLKHLALIAHHCYGSHDLALRCVMLLRQRGVLPPEAEAIYRQCLGADAGV